MKIPLNEAGEHCSQNNQEIPQKKCIFFKTDIKKYNRC